MDEYMDLQEPSLAAKLHQEILDSLMNWTNDVYELEASKVTNSSMEQLERNMPVDQYHSFGDFPQLLQNSGGCLEFSDIHNRYKQNIAINNNNNNNNNNNINIINSTGTFRLNLSEEINWEELNTVENAQFPPIVPLSIPPSLLDSFSSPKVSIDNLEKSEFLLEFHTDLFSIAYPDMPELEKMKHNRGLSKPSFSPDPSQIRLVCGTEDQSKLLRSKVNRLIFTSIDENKSLDVWIYPVTDYIRDIDWFEISYLSVAIGNQIGILKIGEEFNGKQLEVTILPQFHQDDIRELKVSPFDHSHLLSGGFDGNIYISNLSCLKFDTISHGMDNVVGSVRWNPHHSQLFSCTTDNGALHLFDYRDFPHPLSSSFSPKLYTHCYLNDQTLILGYGDGNLELFDLRMRKSFEVFKDPFCAQIGDIEYSPYRKQFITSGSPSISLWSHEKENFNYSGYYHLQAETNVLTTNNTVKNNNNSAYKNSACFVSKQSHHVGATDSNGFFSLFHI